MTDHLDDLTGEALERIVRRHHRRRLEKLGRGSILEQAQTPTEMWVPGLRGPRRGNAVDVLVDGDEAVSMSKLIPIYPLTAKLYSWDLQKVVSAALDLVTGVPDVLTPGLRERFEVLDVMQALR